MFPQIKDRENKKEIVDNISSGVTFTSKKHMCTGYPKGSPYETYAAMQYRLGMNFWTKSKNTSSLFMRGTFFDA